MIYSEPGGRMEAELAQWVTENELAPADRRVHGGPLHGRDAGHELRPRRHDRRKARWTPPAEKIASASRDAGITVAEQIEDIPGLIAEKIAQRAGATEGSPA